MGLGMQSVYNLKVTDYAVSSIENIKILWLIGGRVKSEKTPATQGGNRMCKTYFNRA